MAVACSSQMTDLINAPLRLDQPPDPAGRACLPGYIRATGRIAAEFQPTPLGTRAMRLSEGGGYRLNRRPEEYTLAEILNLTEGTLAPVSCMENGQCSCDRTQDCRTKPIWTELDNLIQNYLESVTLAAFLTPHLS